MDHFLNYHQALSDAFDAEIEAHIRDATEELERSSELATTLDVSEMEQFRVGAATQTIVDGAQHTVVFSTRANQHCCTIGTIGVGDRMVAGYSALLDTNATHALLLHESEPWVMLASWTGQRDVVIRLSSRELAERCAFYGEKIVFLARRHVLHCPGIDVEVTGLGGARRLYHSGYCFAVAVGRCGYGLK